MNPHSENYKEPLPHIEDEPTNERQPPGRSDERHESGESAPRLEHRIGKGTASLLALHTRVAVAFLVASSFLVHFDRIIPEAKAVLGQLIPVTTEPSPVRPGPERSTDLDLTNVTKWAANEASSIIDHVRQDATSVTRPKGRNRIANPADAITRPTESRAVAGPCSGQPVPQFRTRIGVPISLRCENGQWRVHEVTSVASIASTWGDAPASER